MDHQDCQHVWEYSSVMLDFGRFGIRSRICTHCRTAEESDPCSGEWPGAGKEGAGAGRREHKAMHAYGAIWGRVQPATGVRAFTLTDQFGQPVSCTLDPGDEQMMPLQGALVTVDGWLSRDAATGRPISISRIRRIESRPEVVPGSYRLARGVLPVGSEAPEIAIRRIRDAE